MISYADTVRRELMELTLKRPCCKKALAAGLLIASETNGRQLTARYKQQAVAELATTEFRRQFGKPPETRALSAYGHTVWELSFFSNAAAKLTAAMDGGELTALLSPSCEGCRSSFLRGVFLACATVSDPRKSTHLEFLLPAGGRVALLSDFLTECGYAPGAAERNGNVGLYFKNSGSVEDLLALVGAGRAVMELMNLRIEREIRNQENRATNCVAKNIEKSVSAASRQMAAIEKLTVTGMLAQLPEAVRVTALLRAENPDASLEELRGLHNPPITKSGLNHRLQRLLTEADKI